MKLSRLFSLCMIAFFLGQHYGHAQYAIAVGSTLPSRLICEKNDTVVAIKFSPNGREVAFLSPTMIKVVNVTNNTNIASIIHKNSGSFCDICFARGGHTLHVIDNDGKVYRVDSRKWNLERLPKFRPIEELDIVTFSGFKNNHVLTASRGAMSLNRLDQQKIIPGRFNSTQCLVQSAVFAEGHQLLFSAGSHSTPVAKNEFHKISSVNVYNCNTNKCIMRLPSNNSVILALELSPDEQLLGVCKSSSQIDLYSLPALRLARVIKVYHGYCNMLAFSPDSRFAICACLPHLSLLGHDGHDCNSYIEVWDLKSIKLHGKPLLTIRIPNASDRISRIALSPNGKMLVVATERSRCFVFRLEIIDQKSGLSPKEIIKYNRLIKDLGNNSYNMREEASVKLNDMFIKFYPLIKKEIEINPDPEVKKRIWDLIRRNRLTFFSQNY